MQHLHTKKSRQRGISYIELVIATAVLTISLIPAMEALNAAQMGSRINAELQEQHYALMDVFERTLSEPFTVLDAEALALADRDTPSTVYSDSAVTPNRRLVYIQRYDADNDDNDDDPFTGGDKDILWVRVEIAGTALAKETLVSAF